MQVATLLLLLAAMVSGALTVAFVVAEVIRLRRKGARRGIRGVVATLALTAFTALLTVAQLVVLVAQLPGR